MSPSICVCIGDLASMNNSIASLLDYDIQNSYWSNYQFEQLWLLLVISGNLVKHSEACVPALFSLFVDPAPTYGWAEVGVYTLIWTIRHRA